MINEKKLIFGGTFLILIMILSIIYFCLPKIEIKLNGDKNITLILGETYIEDGATATFKNLFRNKELSVNISGNVDTNHIGKYVVTYSSNKGSLKKEIIKIVNIVENIAPELILTGDVIGCKKNNTIEYDIKAIDNYDGDITNNIKYNINTENITFFVSDSSNNKSTLTKKIKYIDSEKPVIKLNNSNNLYLNKGQEYIEYGATAYDSCDGNISQNIKITSNIDINTLGIYEVIYSITDSDGNVSEEKRYITVGENEEYYSNYKVVNGATIYLTFDDGPGPYTETLLKILDEYNIKATFFVTSQFPKYLPLIKQEYESGHTIGVHTYTHKWSIYSSVETYLNDFNLMNNIIYAQTGEYAKVFRFPGGSSNTVSCKYHKGIMTELTNLMEQNGYKYYDWTLDSGDTSKKDNSTNAIINNVKENLKGDGEYMILMHDIKKNTIEALPKIIQFALANGYTFSKITDESIVPHFTIAN